jgi:tRNA dimethylallyltransferase
MKALVILGPTAAGKSRIALELSENYGGEIVCIDSRTVYRRIDVGTAKPSPSDRERIPHHMLDLLELNQKCDAAWFAREAREAVRDICGRGKLPILVGGAGFYLRAVLHGLFSLDLYNHKREEFSESLEGVPTDKLYRRLQGIDSESCLRIHRNDRYRIIRALEIFELSGKTMSEHIRGQENDEQFELEAVKIGLNSEREIIHSRINRRTRDMIERGWIEEVQRLIDEGVDPQWPGMQTIGYHEIISYISGEIDLALCIEKISAATRQYAKRQLTWFRKEEGVEWLDIAEDEPLRDIPMILDKEGSNW